jgi:hypothetical protein
MKILVTGSAKLEAFQERGQLFKIAYVLIQSAGLYKERSPLRSIAAHDRTIKVWRSAFSFLFFKFAKSWLKSKE